MANRLKPRLLELIRKEQSAFVGVERFRITRLSVQVYAKDGIWQQVSWLDQAMHLISLV